MLTAILHEIWFVWWQTKITFLRAEIWIAERLCAKNGGLWNRGVHVRFESLKAEAKRKM